MCVSCSGRAPLPLFRPSRAQVRELKDELTAHTRIQCALDAKERPLHCHHEKTIVIDDRIAFVGGIDLTTEAGDRFDSTDHPARGTSAGTTHAPGSKVRPSRMSPTISACAGTR